ncbi:MAG: hypothetical protein DI589_20835 [Shinella sp.]|nr:MAG: hypothetical protein DI589_20835 [Shinella sp.]
MPRKNVQRFCDHDVRKVQNCSAGLLPVVLRNRKSAAHASNCALDLGPGLANMPARRVPGGLWRASHP